MARKVDEVTRIWAMSNKLESKIERHRSRRVCGRGQLKYM